jgi:hypothetical protein
VKRCIYCGHLMADFETTCDVCKNSQQRFASSEASEGAKPPTREGGGDRVERFDGLHASEASGGSHE